MDRFEEIWRLIEGRNWTFKEITEEEEEVQFVLKRVWKYDANGFPFARSVFVPFRCGDLYSVVKSEWREWRLQKIIK
jgi:hypothetical protein